MGATETWKTLEVTVLEVTENDGAVFMRKGAGRIEQRFTLTDAVARYGKAKVVEMLRDYANTLEGRR